MKSDYKKILKSLPLGVLVIDTNGLIVFCNKKAEKILNLDENKIIKSSLENIFFDTQKIRRSVNTILRNNIDEIYDIYEKKGGSTSKFIGMTITKCTKYSNSERLIIFIKDHTKEFLSQKRHKEMEKKLEISEKLEQKRQDYYLGIVGHELKTPLATIKAFAQISQRYLDKDEKDKVYISLSKIDIHVNELTKLVNELLDVTKIRADKLQFYKEVFNFDVLVKEAIQEIKRDFPDFNILRKGKTNKLVLADKNRIKQILNTLISNAVKYSSSSNKIIIELFSNKNDVSLKVRDFGIGIPKGKHKEIFEAFSKVSDLNRKLSPGLGLALYIASEIAKLHGGRICAESFCGKGSMFNLILPTKK